MIEEWKDIILSDYKGLYKISNTGKILHLEREKTNKMDVFANKEFILNSKISRGYGQVQLTNKERKNKLFYVHYLVALHFVYNPKPNEYLYINHKDENKLNNKADNLEWCTSSYNNLYKDRAKKVGEKIRVYINVYEYENDKFKFIKRCKITDCLVYNAASAIYKSLRTHKIVYSYKCNKYYRYSYDNI